MGILRPHRAVRGPALEQSRAEGTGRQVSLFDRLKGTWDAFTGPVEGEAHDGGEGPKERGKPLNVLFELAPDAYYLNDFFGYFVDGNRAAEELVGYTRDQLIGKNFLELRLLTPESLPKASYLLAQNAAGESTGPDELVMRRGDGSKVTVEVRTHPVEIEGRRLVLGIARDITKRKRNEEALRKAKNELERRVKERTAGLEEAIRVLRAENAERRQAEQALRQEEERYRAVVTQTPDCIYLVDPETYAILEHNPALPELLGTIPKNLFDFLDHEREDIERKIARIRADRSQFLGERRYLRSDGSTVPMLVSASLIEYGGQEVLCVVARDVRQLKQLEEQLRWSQRMEAIGRMAGGIAHDFNNLLSVVSMCAQRAEHRAKRGDPVEDLLEDVREIQAVSMKGAELANQLLAFGRQQVLAQTRLDLNIVVEETIRMARRVAGRRITWQTELCEELSRVLADRGQLEQVLMNLLINARDAMSEGGEISIRSFDEELTGNGGGEALPPDAAPGRYATVTVSDTGVGMERETADRVFEPFFSTKGDEGTGLGLAVAFGIVRQHGGMLTVRSAPGEGATFTVRLPVAE
jgi:PAS domain S-box-containing protein